MWATYTFNYLFQYGNYIFRLLQDAWILLKMKKADFQFIEIASISTDVYLPSISHGTIQFLSLNLLQKICFFNDFLVILLKKCEGKYIKTDWFLKLYNSEIVSLTKVALVKSFYSNQNKPLVLFRHTGMPVHETQ